MSYIVILISFQTISSINYACKDIKASTNLLIRHVGKLIDIRFSSKINVKVVTVA